MRYNVAGLLKSPTGTARRVDVDDPIDVGELDVDVIAPVRGTVRLLRDHAGVLVEGKLATRARVACARCLEPVEVELDIDLTEHFRPTVLLAEGPPILFDPDEENETATEIDQHHTLDLGPVVRQLIVLAVPLHPLCRPDCAGLCPTCGHDRNLGACDCQPEPDARWAALAPVRAMIEKSGAGRASRTRGASRSRPIESATGAHVNEAE